MDKGSVKLGILGGTFNPPHLGHIGAAKAAFDALGLDKILLIPAGEPPHKRMPPDSASSAQRLEMTRLAASELPRAEVCELELDRKGPSYTVDTLGELKKLYPSAKIFLICGTDMFLTLEMWREYEKIFTLATPVAAARDEDDRKTLVGHAKMLKKLYGVESMVLENTVVSVSSSELRAELAAGRGTELLPPEVFKYIKAHGLYGVK